MPENENAVAQEFETPRLSKWLIALAIISLVSPSCSSYAEDSFPLIKKENQQTIINSLSHSLCEMAQASIPIGGDTETAWAASEVQKLHQEVITKKRPFLQQMSAIYEMTGYFSYGMNYAISNFGLYSCPTEANHALHSMQVCDSLAANVRKSGCKDMMAIADLACHSYYYTQLYLFILNKINGNEEYKDRDFRYPLQNLGLLRHVYEKQLFGENDFLKAYFVLDAVCFFKTFCSLSSWFSPSEEKYDENRVKIIEYATSLDKVSTPVFEAIYAGEKTALAMTDEEFENFMLQSAEMKVGIMKMITEGMIQIAAKELSVDE